MGLNTGNRLYASEDPLLTSLPAEEGLSWIDAQVQFSKNHNSLDNSRMRHRVLTLKLGSLKPESRVPNVQAPMLKLGDGGGEHVIGLSSQCVIFVYLPL